MSEAGANFRHFQDVIIKQFCTWKNYKTLQQVVWAFLSIFPNFENITNVLSIFYWILKLPSRTVRANFRHFQHAITDTFK